MRHKLNLRDVGDTRLLYLSLAVGALLRLYGLGSQSIWGDEALTLQSYAAGATIRDVLANIWDKAFHPPLYFLIVHYWTALGSSEAMLRFPSAVFGIAAIPTVYLITRRFFRTGAAGIAALVVAVSPFHLWYSQEARMYSLQVLLCGVSTLFFLRAWKTRKAADYALYAVFTLAGLYTHIGTLLLVAGHGVFVLGAAFHEKKRLLTWLAVFAVVLLAFAPWMVNFARANRDIGGDSQIGFARGGRLLQPAYAIYTFSVGFSLGPSVSGLHSVPARTAVLKHLTAILLTAMLFGALLIGGLARAYKQHRFAFWFFFTSFALPVVLVGMAALIPGVALNARYLVVAIIPFWILLALGIQSSARVRGGIVLPLLAMALTGVSIRNYYLDPAYGKQDMRSAVRTVSENARPGDVIVISSVELGGPFVYYFTRSDMPYLGYPPGRGLVDAESLPRDMRRILHGKKRAWLVLGRTWSSDPLGLIPRFFRQRYEVVENRAHSGVTVMCFDLSRSPGVLATVRPYACYHQRIKVKKLLTNRAAWDRMKSANVSGRAADTTSSAVMARGGAVNAAGRASARPLSEMKIMHVRKQIAAALVLLFALLIAGDSALAAISTPLTAYSSNRHYLANNGQPVVVLGAGQVRCSLKTDDYRAYIDHLAAHKVNYARVWHLRVWDARNNYFPWARDAGGTAVDGGAKYNLSHWDTNFWNRLKDACAYAQSKNVYLCIMLWDECGLEVPQSSSDHRRDWHPFNPLNNVNGLSLPTSPDCVPDFYNLSDSKLRYIQEQYVSKLISETSGYPNVLYEICNEYTCPWDWEKYWIDFITARCSNVVTVQRLGTFPGAYWTDSNIDVVKTHWGTTSPSVTNSNMVALYPKNRAVIYDETPEISSISYNDYRRMLWASFVGGGHIHLENGVNPSPSLDAVMHARNFLDTNAVRFWEMSPNNSLVTRSPGGSAFTLAKPGSEYVVYISGSGGGSMTMNLTPGYVYAAKAYNPSTGVYTTLTVSGNTISGIPSYSADMVVYVKASGQTAVTPPSIKLTLAADRAYVVPGDVVTYTLAYQNTASGDAQSVQVTCPVPKYTTHIAGSAASGAVQWSIPKVSAGGSGALSFKAKVD